MANHSGDRVILGHLEGSVWHLDDTGCVVISGTLVKAPLSSYSSEATAPSAKTKSASGSPPAQFCLGVPGLAGVLGDGPGEYFKNNRTGIE